MCQSVQQIPIVFSAIKYQCFFTRCALNRIRGLATGSEVTANAKCRPIIFWTFIPCKTQLVIVFYKLFPTVDSLSTISSEILQTFLFFICQDSQRASRAYITLLSAK